jgi:branched-chain amino acid transport system permease protein
MTILRRLAAAKTLVACALLLLIVALIGTTTSIGTQQYFITALVSATIVYGLYTFVGNSGVISFGHISFVAVGAFGAGVMTIPAAPKHFVLPELWSFLAEHSIGNVASLALGAGLGAVYALVVGIPLMRLSGIAAGIATFAVLEITHNVLTYWTKIGPGATTLSLVPTTTGLWQALICAIVAATAAFAYQSSRRGRLLRATREDGMAAQSIGADVTRERLGAFVLSGALAGLGGAALVHQLGSITTNQVYLDLTFLTLAMLVVGGRASLWGATVGALSISLLDSLLSDAENGTLPNGASSLILGVLMAAVLLFRPQGITGGREFGLPRLRRRSSRGMPEPGEAVAEGEPPVAAPTAASGPRADAPVPVEDRADRST